MLVLVPMARSRRPVSGAEATRGAMRKKNTNCNKYTDNNRNSIEPLIVYTRDRRSRT